MNIKKLSAVLSGLLILSSVSALEVNKSELESAGNIDAIVFRNYSGPHSVINTVSEIREIGINLGKSVKATPEKFVREGSDMKYSVIHAIDPETKEKLDADIFIIGKDATVDHINNVRRIIAAYLSTAYGYSDKDASTIATFVTVYNAVYRGKASVFNDKYKKIVNDNISSEKVGMSLNYEDWPGNSQIVIPLSDLNGGLGTIDTSVISDKQVIKSLQGEDDKGLDARKNLVDLKEREADDAEEKARNAQKDSAQASALLKDEQKKAASANKEAEKAQAVADSAQAKADSAQAKADDAQKKADEAKQKAEQNPDDKNAQKQADKAQKDADKAQAEADKAQSKADEAKSAAEEKQKAADDQNKKTEDSAKKAEESSQKASDEQAKADKKRAEAQEERTTIAKDQKDLILQEKENASAPIMYGLKNLDDLGVACTLVKMNTDTGKVMKESPLSVIRGRTVYEDDESFIAVAGTNIGKGAVKLVSIDKETLEMISESKELLSELSALAMRDGYYYCVIQDGKNFHIGKFNNKVEGLLKSTVQVKSATPISITSKGILVTSKDGTPVILKLDDLTQVK